MEFHFFKLEIFIPEECFESLRSALQRVDAGHIGKYDSTMSVSHVTGMWRPLAGAHPYIGREGELHEEPELKVEVTVRGERLSDTLSEIRRVHPYEEPVINVIPLIM